MSDSIVIFGSKSHQTYECAFSVLKVVNGKRLSETHDVRLGNAGHETQS